jgi:hypothetical protein
VISASSGMNWWITSSAIKVFSFQIDDVELHKQPGLSNATDGVRMNYVLCSHRESGEAIALFT